MTSLRRFIEIIMQLFSLCLRAFSFFFTRFRHLTTVMLLHRLQSNKSNKGHMLLGPFVEPLIDGEANTPASVVNELAPF